ncbi:Acetyltransferase (GNAT) family protein [Acinetobacter marinus]|uniref:Acetyltransferase (GNAT) family protein n=2 Tax=Acinetobacter marinus TaxID=281375 RepID=A0A1G6GZ53_9GAMM|nr:GNAT family N-acetyltransferase [Acinetobacter marinus]SDB87241.1 Acetyltransferase (GNAT) family protein [Acinetobacter marinus]
MDSRQAKDHQLKNMQSKDIHDKNHPTTSEQQVQIEVESATDYQGWLTCWQAYQQFYHVTLANQITETTWQRFFDEQIPVHCAVAKCGDEILGIVHYIFHYSTWGAEDYCYFQDLYVDPSARGQQLGQRLIEYVKVVAQARPCMCLYWLTHESNHGARRLYDRLADNAGFIQYRINL